MKKIACLLLLCLLTLAPVLGDERQKTILDYQKELSLTDSQINQIKSALSDLTRYVKTAQTKLTGLESEYRVLLSKDPTVDQARAKLTEIATAQVEVRVYDFQISRRITSALSAEQMRKWRDIQTHKK